MAWLAGIAREEASHARLAWGIVGWCIEEEGPRLLASLLPLVERAPLPAPPREFPPAVEGELAGHGFIAAAKWRQLFSEACAEVTARLRHLAERRAA